MHMGWTAEMTSFSSTDLNLLEFQSKLTHGTIHPSLTTVVLNEKCILMWYYLRAWHKDQTHNLFGWDLYIWPELLFEAESPAAGEICSTTLVFNDPRCHFPKENRRLVKNYESPLAPRTLNKLAEMYSMSPFWTYIDWDTSSWAILQKISSLIQMFTSTCKILQIQSLLRTEESCSHIQPIAKKYSTPPFFVAAALKRSQVYNIFCQTHH